MTRRADSEVEQEMSWENSHGFHPAPWRWVRKLQTNRATILDAGGKEVFAGMNINKARIIVGAINRDDRTNFDASIVKPAY